MHRFVAQCMPTLLALYNSPSRYYHNMDHINFCLARFEEARKDPEFSEFDSDQWFALYLAIWFHDAIYNPEAQMVTPKYSEEESIDLMYSLAPIGNHNLGRQIDLARGLIEATAEHGKVPKDLLTSLMVDIDMSSLGLPWEQFKVNTDNVVKEYAVFRPLSAIEDGNMSFLENLVKNERLYYTDWGFRNFESEARHNVRLRGVEINIKRSFR